MLIKLYLEKMYETSNNLSKILFMNKIREEIAKSFLVGQEPEAKEFAVKVVKVVMKEIITRCLDYIVKKELVVWQNEGSFKSLKD